MWQYSNEGIPVALSIAGSAPHDSKEMKIDYTRHYRKWHTDSPEHRANQGAYYRRVLAGHLPEDRSARILDVGCGMGFTMLALKDLGFKSMSGVDCDEGQVASSQAKGLEVSLTDDTTGFLNLKRLHFELILAFDVIEHVPREQQLEFVQAIFGALVPGGKLLCTVPNANSAIGGRWRYIDWTHHCSFTEHSLDFLLSNAGFSNIQVSEVEFIERPNLFWLPISGARHWWAFRFFRLWRRLQMMAELGPEQGRVVPLSLNLLASARKS
jgi:SAM-dependent methyltransferase